MFQNVIQDDSRLLSSHILHGQLDTATLIDIQNAHQHFIAFVNKVRDIVNTLLADLGNVNQTVFTWKNVHKCTEVRQTYNLAC